MRRLVFILLLVVSMNSALAQRGATVPWLTYEAENGIYTGSLRGPSYAVNTVEAESSGRQCVRLSSTGQYVQFTNQTTATAIVVRYSVPDTSDGVGADYTLSLYKNGTLVGRLPVTSKYSWLYGNYPYSNTPSQGSSRNLFDEVRTNGVSITAGDVIKLQKDNVDTASYYDIDLIDMENVPAAASQPGGFVSVTNYGADPSGVNDSTTALQNCINANGSVWLPAGIYKITSSINLPSNKKVRGAGMWYSTLVGDPSLYGSSNRRVTLSGNGSNIQLSDFAIVGKLNYRNDGEPNDGLGGKYGTGSVISNIWVEHTKTGAWIVNSSALVVSSCRFRNTIADGINLCVGMRSTTVTNCATRGTGDDCFAVWPATYISATYAPGLNVIKNCTGQLPFLANGGALYGGDSNRIEDCLFQDMPYGCGILISTTFAVSTNFSGTTVAQRSDLNRCGGTRAGLEICLQNRGISGVDLNNLNITNSITHGLGVTYGAENGLANAIMSNVRIPNYDVGGSGGLHGLWARNDALGSMTVTNCTLAEYKNDSPYFAFNFVSSTNISVTVQTSPPGRSFTVDGITYNTTQAFSWTPGASHTISTTSVQSGGTGTQYLWSSWSDGGAMSHTITPTVSGTFTANFSTQYYLTMNAGPGGSVSPAGGWYNSGASANISATASNGFSFYNWSGSGIGSYSGGNNSASVTMNGPVTETATFISNTPISVTVQSSPPGCAFTVDGTAYTTTQVFIWTPGSSHTISSTTPQSGGTGVQLVMDSWSDSGPMIHTVTPTTDTTYTANFKTKYYLTVTAGPGGNVSPSSGWQNSGASVGISATASNGFSFVSWSGDGTGSYSGGSNPSSVTMNEPITQTASFAPDISVTVQTSPSGRSFTVDGMTYTTTQVFNWASGSSHAIAATSPQSGGTGVQYTWSSWSDDGAMSHTITPSTSETYIANYTTQYHLSMNAATGGSVGPAADWYDSGTNLNITATAADGYTFSGWTGAGTGSYSGTDNPASVTINGPVTQTAGFLALPEILGLTVNDERTVTISYATVSGQTYHVETTTNLTPAVWTTVPGSETNADGGVTIFIDPNTAGDTQRFYRIRSP